jgi:hypothetical protein
MSGTPNSDAANIISTKINLTPSAPAAGVVAATSGLLLAANPDRKSLVICNLSGNTISFGLGQAAVLSSGVTIGAWGVWGMDEYSFYTGAIYAIASAGGTAVGIQEFV